MSNTNIKYNRTYKGFDIVQQGDECEIYKKGELIALSPNWSDAKCIVDNAIFAAIIDHNAEMTAKLVGK